jgi:hypothetical protein
MERLPRRRDRNVLDNVLSILTTCCSNMGDHAEMEKLVRRTVIPHCYRTVALKPSAATKQQMEMFKQARTHTRRLTPCRCGNLTTSLRRVRGRRADLNSFGPPRPLLQ